MSYAGSPCDIVCFQLEAVAELYAMYEAAWHILFEYRYGYPQDKVPAPWYDEVSDRHDKAVVMTAVTEGTQEG